MFGLGIIGTFLVFVAVKIVANVLIGLDEGNVSKRFSSKD